MDSDSFIEPCNNECVFCFLNYTDALIQNPLFHGVEKQVLGTIIKRIHHKVKQLETDEVLAVEGDVLHQLWIIVEGAVAGEMMDYTGNLLRVEKLIAPQTIATAFLFGKGGKLPVTITATEPTKILCIPRHDLVTLFSQHKKIMQNFLDIISERAQFLSQRIKVLSISSLRGKLAFYLLQQVKQTGKTEFLLPHTQQELAEQFGATRPSVGRILSQLNDENIIETERKQIRILDKKALAFMLSH
jgi:CRP-like cAMP-binding protein